VGVSFFVMDGGDVGDDNRRVAVAINERLMVKEKKEKS
jgi:hypothetical protein